MRKCGYCGEPGHNRRTCPKLKADKEAELEEEVVVEEPKRKKSPYKPLPEGVEIGPKLMECGHFSWWLKDGECELCSGALYRRRLNDPIEEAA